MQKKIYNNNLIGIFYIILAALFFSLMSLCAKFALAKHHVIEIIFLRSLISITLLTLLIKLNKKKISNYHFKLHSIRAILGLGAMFCTFTALKYMPLSNLTIISFSKIFFLIPLAIFIFREPINTKSLIYVILGFIGVIVIVGYEIDNIMKYKYYLLALLGAFFISLVKIIIKKLSHYEKSHNIQFWFSFFCFFLLLSPYFYFATIPNCFSLIQIILTAIFGLLAQYFTIEGLRISKSTIVMPFDFFRIIFATCLGVLFFSEHLTYSLLIGSLIIIFSGIKLIKIS